MARSACRPVLDKRHTLLRGKADRSCQPFLGAARTRGMRGRCPVAEGSHAFWVMRAAGPHGRVGLEPESHREGAFLMPIVEYGHGTPFAGVIGRTIEESSPAWPAMEGAPN